MELEHHVSIMSPLRGPHQRHSNTEFVRAYKQRDYSAIDGRTYAGREAKLWREAVIRLKGGASCPFHLKVEINSASFDLWLMLDQG